MEILKMGLWVLLLSLVLGCQNLIFDSGDNQLLKEYHNPKSNMKALVFEKPGSATVNNSIHISIQTADFELGKEDVGNVFVADKIEGIIDSIGDLLTINWIDSKTIVLTYPKEIRTFKTETQFGDVEIEYIIKK